MTKVLSVGGSIIVPDKPDTEFLTSFVKMCTQWLDENKSNKLILVAGGGAPAGVYQNAYNEVSSAGRPYGGEACCLLSLFDYLKTSF